MPRPSVKHIPQRPSAAFKDTPSQLSMKTLCIETRFWGSNMNKRSATPAVKHVPLPLTSSPPQLSMQTLVLETGYRDVPWREGCALARGMCPG